MPLQGREIFGAIIAVSLVVILLSSLIIIVIINYKRKTEKHDLERKNMMLSFENERIMIETEVEEETRQNLASELHDNIGQLMSLTNVILSSIDMNEPPRALEKVRSAQELVLRSIREMRQLTKLVQGQNILSAGLQEAMDQELKWLQRNEYYKISCSFPESLDKHKNEEKDLIIFRLFQESLHNIIKHAEATSILIDIALKDSTFHLRIEDNGKGFNVEETGRNGKGLGIKNMQKRIQMLNGYMQIESSPFQATILTFTIPYPEYVQKEN